MSRMFFAQIIKIRETDIRIITKTSMTIALGNIHFGS